LSASAGDMDNRASRATCNTSSLVIAIGNPLFS
jgi:hypothetical protein